MEPTDYFLLAIFIALGAFSLIAAIFNFDWYFETSGAATFVNQIRKKRSTHLLCFAGVSTDRVRGAGIDLLVT